MANIIWMLTVCLDVIFLQDELKAIYHAVVSSVPIFNSTSGAAAPQMSTDEADVTDSLAKINWVQEQRNDNTLSQVKNILCIGSLLGIKEKIRHYGLADKDFIGLEWKKIYTVGLSDAIVVLEGKLHVISPSPNLNLSILPDQWN